VFPKQLNKHQEEELFRVIADASPVMVWLAGCGTLCCYLNSLFKEFLGEPIPKETLIDWVHPEDREQYQNTYITAFAARHSFKRQYRLRRADGEYRWILDTAAPRFAGNGEFIGYSGYCVDITEVTIDNPEIGIGSNIGEHKQIASALLISEARNRAILDAIPDLIFRLSKEGIYLDFMAAKDAQLAIPASEIIGKSLSDTLSTEQALQTIHYIKQALATGNILIYEYELFINGELHDFESRLVPSGEDEVFAIVRDISERKRTEAALLESEAKFRNFVENANELVFSLSTEGIFTYVSPNLVEMLGYEVSEWEGKSFALFVHHEDVSACAEFLTRVVATGKKQTPIEYRVKHKDGSWRWHTTNGAAIKDTQGRSLYFVGIGHDITERRQSEDALQALVAGTASVTGEEFFPAVVRHLAVALGVRYAIVVEKVGLFNPRGRVLAFWAGEQLGENFEYDLANTPCEIAVNEGMAYYPSGVQQQFPFDEDLVMMEAQSYLGASFVDTDGTAIGHIAVLDTKPILQEERATAILRIFAARATAELQRKQIEDSLRQSEKQFRELASKEALVNRLASEIRASLDLNTILETAVSEIHNLLQIDRCNFTWYHSTVKSPYWEIVQEAKNPTQANFLGLQIPHAELGLMGEKSLNKEITRIDDVQKVEKQVMRKTVESFGTTALLTVPIHTQSGEIGAFVCSHYTSSRPWLDSEVELLYAVADQVAIAIDQAELYKQSRNAAQIAQEALRELQQTQAQLIQTEKMSSLGQLVAGVAHEINNPVNFIYANLSHAREYTEDLLGLVKLYQQHYTQPIPEIQQEIETIDLDFLAEDLPKLLDSMKIGAVRIREIVLSLRNFSRLDEAEMKAVDIHEGIENTLLLLQSRLKAKLGCPQIQILKEYGNLPLVECYAGQLNQMFMNLLANAIDALEENSVTVNSQQSTILIRTQIKGDSVIISFADNGSGMNEEVRQRVFDPFFTTKPVGKGTGMGLSISYQIVLKHGGRLDCISAPGQGAEFLVCIPLHQKG
jgi:PAS domain S-box-containing protein